MTTYEYEGWVESVERNDYGAKIEARSDESDSDSKFPVHLLFDVSKKNVEKVPADLGKNDKIKVSFMPYLRKGIGKNTGKPYAIQTLMLQKIDILAKADKASVIDDPMDPDEELPF